MHPYFDIQKALIECCQCRGGVWFGTGVNLSVISMQMITETMKTDNMTKREHIDKE